MPEPWKANKNGVNGLLTCFASGFSVKELIIKANEPLTSQGHVETVP